jgi:hypothetical protein
MARTLFKAWISLHFFFFFFSFFFFFILRREKKSNLRQPKNPLAVDGATELS